MKEIEWKRYYELGIKETDEQHKHLIGILNEMIKAKNEGKTDEIFGKIIKELVDYTQYHFSSEEKYMERFNYPALAEHKAQHKMLVKQIVKLLEDVKEGKTQVGDKLFDFLKHWIIRHVLDHDKQFGLFLEEAR